MNCALVRPAAGRFRLGRTLGITVLLGVVGAGLPRAGMAQGSVPLYNVRTLTDTILGGVGGVAVDGLGAIYVADFGESVWKVSPSGTVTRFARGLYGSSGNAIDAHGNLFQSNFTGQYVSKINRLGESEIYADTGLAGPVGVTIDGDGNLYVTNCGGNRISKITTDRVVSTFASGRHFNCPNGITRDVQGNTYVVNFSDGRMIKILPDGTASEFAVLPGGGNGHVTFARGNLYATSFRGHRIYQVSLEGEVTLVAGTGAIGEHDGPGAEATFTFPNGIAPGPQGDRLYVNDFLNRSPPGLEVRPQPLSIVRQIMLPSLSSQMVAALQSGGIDEMVATYQAWKTDPSTANFFTEIEINGLGYQLVQNGQLPAATRVFQLNAESYPQSWNVYDSLAEAYMNGGDNDRAVELYERSLQLNPANTNAEQMLERIRGG